MNNEELLDKYHFEDTDRPNSYGKGSVRKMLDAARKDEALKAIQFVLNNGTGDWYRMDAEELYKLFNPQNKSE